VIKNVKFILIAHDTPVDKNDNSDLTSIFNDLHKILPFIKHQYIHITAQLPAGTSFKIMEAIQKNKKNFKRIAYSPENLRLGQAIERYLNPPLPVIGTNDNNTFNALSNLYSSFSKNWEKTDLLSSEFLKHALNTFLATSITLANEIGNITDLMGANGHEVGRLLKLEPRIGKKAMLRPGMGFSGGTLARDVKSLMLFSKDINLNTPLLNGLWKSNKNQNLLPVNIINRIFKNKDKSKVKISILGLTYKPETSTLRRSLSLEIIKILINSGYNVSSFDPMADRIEIRKYNNIGFNESINECVKNANMILSITPWASFKELNFKQIKKLTSDNYFFDISGLFDKKFINKFGFKFLSIGDGSLTEVIRK